MVVGVLAIFRFDLPMYLDSVVDCEHTQNLLNNRKTVTNHRRENF